MSETNETVIDSNEEGILQLVTKDDMMEEDIDIEDAGLYKPAIQSRVEEWGMSENMSKYKISVSFDEKNFFWIIIDKEKLIKNPTKEDLIGTKIKSYNKTNICPRCREKKERDGIELTDKSILYPGNARKEKEKNGKETERWVCSICKSKDYNDMPDSYKNIIKPLKDCRTGNQNPNSNQVKGKKSQKLACMLYEWEDLNEKYDNYKSPLDCYDPKTGLYHQVQGRYYNSVYQWWNFTHFENEWKKIFENMVCFCISKDEKIVERIYIFPLIEITRVKGIAIAKNSSRGVQYEKYRVKDKDELKKANDIWTQILEAGVGIRAGSFTRIK